MVDWKKEIKLSDLRRKPKDTVDVEPEAAVAPEPVAAPQPRDETPFWKKEISFSRKQRAAEPVAAAAAPAEAPTEPADAVPFWKKEISFSRKKAAPTTDVVVAAPAVPEPVLPVEPAAAYEAPTALDPDVAAAVELLNAYVQPTPPPAAAAPPVPVEVVVEPYVADVARDSVLPPEPESAAAAAVELFAVPQPAHEDVTAVLTPEPVELAPEAPAVEPIAAASAPVAEPAPAAQPVVVHPPVPAAALPPLDDEKKKEKKEKKRGKAAKTETTAGENVPFYKRELSFGRKKSTPAAEKSSEKKVKEPKANREKPAADEKPKRERRSLSLPRPQPRGGKAGAKMPKRLVGLKIGSSQVAAAIVENNGHAEVVQMARASLDPGVVSNGELRDPDLLAEALREFFKENKLPKRGVRLGIATNRIGVRTLEISGIEDAKQLANAIRFRAQEALPIPIDEAVLDYQILRDDKNEEGESVRKILLVLAYRDLIDRYVDACRKAGIQLVGIDLEAFALVRALAAPREEATPAQSALVAVTIGHDRATFAVSDGRVCEFTRVLDWGGQSINVAIARALDMAPSEVDHIKRALSVNGTEIPEGLSVEHAQAARDALRKQVQSFARELVSSLQFYQNQPGSLGIGEIIITGGTAHLGGLAEELQRLIGVRVRVGDPLVRVKPGKKLAEPEQLGSLAVAIGLGIED